MDAEPCPVCAESGELLHGLPGDLGAALCASCGLVHLSPHPDPATLKTHYATGLRSSGPVFRSMEPGSRPWIQTRAREATLRAALAGRATGTLLDVGCGTGGFAAGLDLPGWRRMGLEPNPWAARAAREAGLEVVDSDLDGSHGRLPPCDAITLLSVLEHLPDPVASLRSLRASAAEEAVLIVEVPDLLQETAQLLPPWTAEHLVYFTPNALGRALRRAGWTPVNTEEGPFGAVRLTARAGDAFPTESPADAAEVERLRQVVDRIQRARDGVVGGIRQRIGRIPGHLRLAVFGAGEHTRALLAATDLGTRTIVLLDNRANLHGTSWLGLPVRNPEAIDALRIGAVVVSSAAFETEMVAQLEPWSRRGVLVVPLYA